jgi:hypothetical protein
MRILLLFFTLALLVSTVQGCVTDGSGKLVRRETSTDSRKEVIINRLVPEDGLPPARRARVIDATVAVLRKVDREQLQSPNRLRDTLRAASLEDLEKIEANYKELIANMK